VFDAYVAAIEPANTGDCLFNKALRSVADGDTSRARTLYRESADGGNAMAMVNLGALLISEDEHAEGPERLFREAAGLGDLSGMRNLAHMHALGKGTPKNKELAVKWYWEAARRGHAKAQCNLAVMLRHGRGTMRDPMEAVKWYTASAESGYFRAQASLAAMYLAGEGVERDVGSAFYWYSKAADNGSSRGMYGLGLMLLDGIGADRDEDRAEALFRAASEKGCSKTTYALGEMLELRGLTEEALRLYERGAEKKEARCALNIVSHDSL
jgi:TPR repeat protein